MDDETRHNEDPDIRFFVAIGRARQTQRKFMVWTPYSVYIEDKPEWRDMMRRATLEKAVSLAGGEPCDIERWAVINNTDQLDMERQFMRNLTPPDWHYDTF